jgi:hypothetical protein
MIVEAAPQEATKLNAHDRCDRCGSQAYVRVLAANGKLALLFCNHHFGKHADSLLDSGWTVTHDQRDELTVKP